MDRNSFEVRLRIASQRAIVFAREFVRQRLHDEAAFLVYPNQSCDENPLLGDEMVFPDESMLDGQYHGPWSFEEVVAFLWRSGKVPEWIDTAVEAEEAHRSIIGLRCCGRFTASEDLLYHRYLDGVPPFSIKSTILPPGWESVEVSGRFDLYWQRAASRSK